MPLRTRTRFLILVVKRENKRRKNLPGPRRSTHGRLGGEFLDYITVISGGVVDIRSDLVVVPVIGPARFRDPDPKIRIPEALHREDESVDHLIKEVVVSEIRHRIHYRYVGGLENGVIEIYMGRVLGPSEVRVHVDE